MTDFVDVCALSDLEPERGVGALVAERQVAVFRLADDTVRVVQQRDPYSRANVMARGLVGTTRVAAEDGTERDVATVTTPMLKQVWNMETGAVIDSGGKPKYPIEVFDAKVVGGRVLIASVPNEVVPGE